VTYRQCLHVMSQDTFTKATPVKSGIGMLMLKRMGWKEGEGLGKNNEGTVEPLAMEVKVDRKGQLLKLSLVQLITGILCDNTNLTALTLSKVSTVHV
jgi:hypothetical protein